MAAHIRIAILTAPGDYHAHAVAWALRSKACHCDLIFFSDLPQQSVLSFIPSQDWHAYFTRADAQYDLSTYDRVWIRKPNDPVLGPVHPSDRVIAKVSWGFTLDGLLRSLDYSGVFCVSSGVSSELSRLKTAQLQAAVLSGLNIPRTVVSSDIVAVSEFIASNAQNSRSTIVKGMYSHLWDLEEGGIALLDTTFVTASDLEEDGLRISPCIFQEEIEKSYEVRLTVMGNAFFAAKLATQDFSDSQLDFRKSADWAVFGCDEIEVPDTVKLAVLKFHSITGLIFGTMDFIVTKGGEWVFLETNPFGQFLWVENVNPRIPLLDAFSDFIIGGTRDFKYECSAPGVDMVGFANSPASAKATLAAELVSHPRQTQSTEADVKMG